MGTLPSRIWVARPDGAGAQPLTQPHCRPGHPPLRGCFYDSAAPGGRQTGAGSRSAAIRSRSATAIPGQPWTTGWGSMHPDGSGLHTLARCTGGLCNQIMTPAWSPDGSRLAYAPKSEHGPSIAIVTPKGSGTTIRTCANAHCVTPTDLVWAPDGRSLGLLSEARSSTAYAIHTSGGGMHPVGDDAQCCLAWLSSR